MNPRSRIHKCVVCGEEDEEKFYKSQKSLCKRHKFWNNRPEVKAKISRGYFCLVCGQEEETEFHKYRKNLCIDHHNYNMKNGGLLERPPVKTLKEEGKYSSDGEENDVAVEEEIKHPRIAPRRTVIGRVVGGD